MTHQDKEVPYVGFDTVNCVVCGRAAYMWTGHVLVNSGLAEPLQIVAGWCTDHEKTPYEFGVLDKNGCAGVWRPEMGITHRN